MNASHTQTRIIEVGEKAFEAEVLKATRPVIVEFSATWSRPCQVLDSVLDEVATTCAAQVKFARVDADNNPDLSLWFGIQSIPTLLYFLRGKVHARIVGTATKEAILAKLQTIPTDRDGDTPDSSGTKQPALKMKLTPQSLLLISVTMVLTACSRTAAPPPTAPPQVATVTVAQHPALLMTELPGRTAPFRVAEIRPQVNGLILKRLFTEGSDVEEGQQLYQIDPAPFRAALDNAKAALGRAEANLPAIQSRAHRYRQALAEKAVSQQDFDDAEAALKQAEADIQYHRAMVETARITLNYATVVSPISGRIGASVVTDGAIVTAYQPLALATIQQLDPIYVDVMQSSTELLRLQRHLHEGQLSRGGTNGSEVEIILSDGTKYPLTGKLQFRDVSVDPSTASVILRLVFPNPDGVLLPGMFVRAVVKEGVNDQAILIPQQTVSRDPKGNPYALLVDANGKVEQRSLTLDRAIGNQWLVSSGLAPGDRVIAEGMQKVRAGMAVKEVPFDGPQSTGTNPVAPVTTARLP